MRRCLVVVFTVLFGLTLVAAAPGPALLGTPVLVVFPFTANGSSITREAGAQLAVTIATQIANLGGVNVKPAAPGVERQNFLDSSRSENADYYIAGYLTPLGDGVSVVEQLVSTQTGIVVYSNTAQVRTFADAAGQGDVLRDALLRHQSRNLGAYAAPPPPVAAATPAPAAGSATQANLGRLFGRRARTAGAGPTPVAVAVAGATPAAGVRATPAPAPTAAAPLVAAAPRAAASYAVLAIGGSAADELRTFAGAALRNDMLAGRQPVSAASVTRESACQTKTAATLVGGDLSTSRHSFLGRHETTATLDFVASDCAGNILYRRTFADRTGGDIKVTVDGVVARAVGAFLREPANRHS